MKSMHTTLKLASSFQQGNATGEPMWVRTCAVVHGAGMCVLVICCVTHYCQEASTSDSYCLEVGTAD